MRNPISFLLYVVAVVLVVYGLLIFVVYSSGWQWILAGIVVWVLSYIIHLLNVKKPRAIKPVAKKPMKRATKKKPARRRKK